MTETPNLVLIAGGDPERVLLLEEAFLEMEETRFIRGVRGSWERTYALDLEDARDQLKNTSFDVILFDRLSMGDYSIMALLELRRAAPDTAIVVLVGADEEALGLSMVRQGAQDYLVETELDCVPLDRSLRCSMERQKLLVAERSVTLVDDLTGVLNRKGFQDAVARDLRITARYHLWPVLIRVDLRGPNADSDVEVLRLADRIYQESTDTDLLGRLDPKRFALFGVVESELEGDLRLQRLRSVLAPFGRVWTASGPAVEQALCENKALEDSAGRHLQRR